jgi:hypothetical protein
MALGVSLVLLLVDLGVFLNLKFGRALKILAGVE